MTAPTCSHLQKITNVRQPERRECATCTQDGTKWVTLRTCQDCGTTLCCDSSPNQHASKHAREAGHPVIASGQPGERWMYCFEDDLTVEY